MKKCCLEASYITRYAVSASWFMETFPQCPHATHTEHTVNRAGEAFQILERLNTALSLAVSFSHWSSHSFRATCMKQVYSNVYIHTFIQSVTIAVFSHLFHQGGFPMCTLSGVRSVIGHAYMSIIPFSDRKAVLNTVNQCWVPDFAVCWVECFGCFPHNIKITLFLVRVS